LTRWNPGAFRAGRSRPWPRAPNRAASPAAIFACGKWRCWRPGAKSTRGDTAAFINDLLQARYIRTLPITPEIAVLAQSDAFRHGDPADRLVAATALEYGVPLVTADAELRKLRQLKVVW